MFQTAWPAPDKRQIPPVENQLAIFRGTLHANIKTTIRMRGKRSFYSYNFQEDTFRDCGEICDWNTVKFRKIPHRRWEAAATYIKRNQMNYGLNHLLLSTTGWINGGHLLLTLCTSGWKSQKGIYYSLCVHQTGSHIHRRAFIITLCTSDWKSQKGI